MDSKSLHLGINELYRVFDILLNDYESIMKSG